MDGHKMVIVRGGGDMATAVIHRLWRAGFRVLVLETDKPAAIRRQVAASEAVYDGLASVEGMKAIRVESLSQIEAVWAEGNVPLYVDPEGTCIQMIRPAVLVVQVISMFPNIEGQQRLQAFLNRISRI